MPAQTIRPAARSLLTVVVASLLAVAGLTLTPDTAAGSADHERRFVQLINQTRASAGLAPLAVHGELTAQARSWSASMAAADHLSHSPNIAAGISAPWTILGENVGVHGVDDVAQLHAAFVASPGHYQNLVDARYGYVGVGVVVTENGKIWTTHRFMALDEPATTTTAPTTTVPTTTAPPTTARPTTTTAPPTTRRPTTTASDTTAATTAPTTATTTGRRPAARLSTTAAITPASNTPSPSTTDATAATTSTPKTPTTRPSTSSSSEVPAIPPPPDPIQGSTSAPTTAPATTSTTPWSLPADADDGPAAGDPAALATPAVDEVGPGPADVETVEQLLIDLIAADG